MPRIHRHSHRSTADRSTPPSSKKSTAASKSSATANSSATKQTRSTKGTQNVVTTPKPKGGTVVMRDGFDMSRSTDTTQKTSLTLQQLAAAAAARTDVPGRVQDGPTCGLYALGMVMDFWDNADKVNLNPIVQDGDAWRRGATTRAADTRNELLPTAKQDGYTTQGEMFTASRLGALAEQFGYQSKTTSGASMADIQAAIDRGHPVLVAFDVDFQGNPGLYGGERAHWCVVEGTFEKDGVKYVVAKHAWDGKDRIWKASDLEASMKQLQHSNFWGGEKDISGMLNDRMVEVWPKS